MITIECEGRQFEIAANIRKTNDDWLIFMHGWGAAKEGFAGAFNSIELSKYSICSFDFVGFGRSSRPYDFNYDLNDQSKIAEVLVRELKPRSVTIVGHSMGGGIGMLCASALSDIPVRLLSIEGNLAPGDTGSVTRIIAKMPYKVFELLGFRVIQLLLSFSAKASNRMWSRWWAEASPRAIHKSAQSLVKWSDEDNQMDLFRSLPSKTYIYGDKSIKKRQRILSCLNESQIRGVSNSGHFPMLENPNEFYGLIAKILK